MLIVAAFRCVAWAHNHVDNNHHVAGKGMCVGFLFQGF
jgi:hypothetical protein